MNSNLKKLFHYIWPHRWSFLFASVCLGATNYFTVSIPEQIGIAIDGIADGSSLPAIVSIAWMGILIIVVRSLSRIFFFNPARYVEYDIRQDLFYHLLALQPSFYASYNRGDIISRASNDITWMRVMVGFGGLQLINLGFAFGLTGWKMLDISVSLTIAAIIPISIGFLLVNIVIRRLYPMMLRNQEELSEISEHVLESFQGVSTIQGFHAESAFIEQFAEQNQRWFQTGLRLSFWQAVFTPLLALSSGAAIFALIYVGSPLIIEGELSIGNLAAFFTLIATLIPYLRSIGWMLSIWHRGYASMERIFSLMDIEVERPEGEHPQSVPDVRHKPIQFENLSFAYPDQPEKMILKDISITIPSGAMIGVFGRTGSGKTTLLRLLARSFNPPKGSICIGGLDIRTFDLKSWRKKLSFVPQRPFLFSDTIQGNIALEDTFLEKDIERVVSLASLKQDLDSFEKGLDTIVGERGIMLSGGQRQRVALARGLYKENSLILLDDILSAVDHENEARLVSTLNEISQDGNTCFIVSNRVSAFRYASLILVLEQGRLVDSGTHEELIKREGIYQDTYQAQREVS